MSTPFDFLIQMVVKTVNDPGSDYFLPKVILAQKHDPFMVDGTLEVADGFTLSAITAAGIANVKIASYGVTGSTLSLTADFGAYPAGTVPSLKGAITLTGRLAYTIEGQGVTGSFTCVIPEGDVVAQGLVAVQQLSPAQIGFTVQQVAMVLTAVELTNSTITVALDGEGPVLHLLQEMVNKQLQEEKGKEGVLTAVNHKLSDPTLLTQASTLITNLLNQLLNDIV